MVQTEYKGTPATSNQPLTHNHVVPAQPQEYPCSATTDTAEPLTETQAPITPRPQVKPVYGLCRHIARSENHTCGSWSCIQQYGW
jgi:hypothetical protein